MLNYNFKAMVEVCFGELPFRDQPKNLYSDSISLGAKSPNFVNDMT